ncbi:histidine-containing phosphotransfer protein 1-like isoform X2 [Juglans microcarpa x Juglans regia]|uniref:histidine-containing phosphotransfer protein 1-like isoform X2 n=1 Tax=Juglans microcarpa x Juglans regia TaxID=2249226 RepID=UPI001B7EC463|nr:histidine-containing phosphotransfer protein 1-like isoform X2 [Juglans microcarpa x Juglans regia]
MEEAQNGTVNSTRFPPLTCRIGMRKVLCTVAWLRMLLSLRQIFSSLGALMSFMPCTCIQDIGGVPTMRMVSILQNNKAGQIRLYTVNRVSSSVSTTIQGILDHNFENVQNLQCQENPHFVLEIIEMFCRDAEISIAEMTKYVDEPVVDYAKVTCFIHQLKGSSSSVGGCRIVVACRELRKASENKMKERCIEACNKIKREYFIVRDNLNAIAKMERSIHTDDAMAGIF